MREIFSKLIVLKKSHELVKKVYSDTSKFPAAEKFGLVDDMRRAARSVPTNFVEGYRRKGYKDAMNFFNRSDASLAELEYQILLAFELGFLEKSRYEDLGALSAEVGRILCGWQKGYYSSEISGTAPCVLRPAH